MKRQDNLKAVVTRYIGILNSQNQLSLDKVAELIVSMLGDLETTIAEDMFQMGSDIEKLSDRTSSLEGKLRSVEGDTLGQVVRYVIGESLAKPGGLPADIDRLVVSSQNVEKGIFSLQSELAHLVKRVDMLEKGFDTMSPKSYSRKNQQAIAIAVIVVGVISLALTVLMI